MLAISESASLPASLRFHVSFLFANISLARLTVAIQFTLQSREAGFS